MCVCLFVSVFVFVLVSLFVFVLVSVFVAVCVCGFARNALRWSHDLVEGSTCQLAILSTFLL